MMTPTRQRRNRTFRRAESSITIELAVDQPVHRQRHQLTRPLRLAVCPDQGIGVLAGHNRSDTGYRPRSSTG
jgi:hypothetical protein